LLEYKGTIWYHIPKLFDQIGIDPSFFHANQKSVPRINLSPPPPTLNIEIASPLNHYTSTRYGHRKHRFIASI